MRASVTAHREFGIAKIDDRLYGAFLEHLGRAIYTGIYEPDNKTANGDGMRKDVIELVRELKVPIVRYPGGNFVSAYNWEDGVGPRKDRPTRLDLAWHTSESNAVGVHEFAQWCDAAGTEMMLAINLGSRGLDQARNFVEYVNGPTGSAWGDLRKKHGRAEPFAVKHWCLGNEMDGPWQVGHKTADEYGRLANEVAKTLRAFDPALELIVCGSSHSDMKTYPDWERIVLEHTYDAVDHISLHMYFANRSKNAPEYLALNAKLDAYINAVASTIEFVRTQKRSRKRITISFDEWNVWYHSNEQDREIREGAKGWPHAPRLLEDIYNFEDALQVGLILNTFIRRSDVVKIACIAQLVNVIAPIMTEPGGPAWRQTIFYPYYFASVYGRGEALRLSVKSPGYDFRGRRQRALSRHRRGSRRRRQGADLLRRQPAPKRRARSRRRPAGFRSRGDRRSPGDDERRPPRRQHAEEAHQRHAQSRRRREGQGRAPDREAAALFLPDDAPRPRLRTVEGFPNLLKENQIPAEGNQSANGRKSESGGSKSKAIFLDVTPYFSMDYRVRTVAPSLLPCNRRSSFGRLVRPLGPR